MNAPKVLLIKRPAKLPNGRRVRYFTLRWQDSNGKDRYESLGRIGKVTASEAKALQRQKQLDLGTGKVRRKHQKITLAMFLDMDREAVKAEVKPATIVAHEGMSAHAIAAIGGDRELNEVDEDDVATLKNWLAGEHTLHGRMLSPCSKATIRKTIAGLKASFNRAKNRKNPLIDFNPFIGHGGGKTQSKQMRIFNRTEIDLLVEASDIWWETFLRLAFTSGLRLGEILNLTWDDIDEQAGSITVSAKRPGQFTVGGKSYPVLAFSCKSHRERAAPLIPEVAKLFQRLKMRSGGSIYPFLSLNRLAILAATEDTTQELGSGKLVNNVLRTFKRLQVKVRTALAEQRGVPVERIEWRLGCVHDLRKSFATHMARHISMVELQKLMGHASLTTTGEYYVAVGDDLAEKVQAAFG